ncbi:tRNA 2-selenouridine(34) synthase MnmH [Engelhardtia mirabilis]|uniref:tRNA 2-selenouridine(34) synthase MnmH n=1 Tax=Engelhardtia mirabilis TaxID=2528011 RepID=UPI003AF3C540
MVQKIHLPSATAEQLLESADLTVVDLRSPSEFAEDHVVGAINAPLFDDAERAIVGTLYRQRGSETAFEAGLQITRAKIAALVGHIAASAGRPLVPEDLDEHVRTLGEGGMGDMRARLVPELARELPDGALVVACWRGNLRSQSVAALLRRVGLSDVYFLSGGYKAWRRYIRTRLDTWSPPPSFTLRGLTGVGKSLVLRELERLRPGWTLDLELLAGHRSSILGMVGLEPVVQKVFERRVVERIHRGFPGRLVVEGESRKVGNVILPDRVWQAVRGGIAIELVADVPRRIDVLTEDYLGEVDNREQLLAQLPFIEKRLGPIKYDGVLTGLLEAGREDELVELLLEKYYDPLYRHSEKGIRYAATIRSDEPEVAAAEIAAWVETQG